MFGNKMSKVEKAVQKGKGDKLIELLAAKDDAVRVAAIDGLGKLKASEGVNSLINLLHDSSAEIRKHAALALGAIGDSHAKAHLAHAISIEKDSAVQKAMQQAQGQIKDH